MVWTSTLAWTSIPLGRLVEDEDTRRRGEPFRQDHLLLVAAGQRLHRLSI